MKRKTIYLLLVSLVLSGCLAYMRASNMARHLNYQAPKGTPYVWVAVPLKGDRAKLEQKLAGTITNSTLSEANYAKALQEMAEKLGGDASTSVKEVRLFHKQPFVSESIESWVIDFSNGTHVFTVEIDETSDGQTFNVRGPWEKAS